MCARCGGEGWCRAATRSASTKGAYASPSRFICGTERAGSWAGSFRKLCLLLAASQMDDLSSALACIFSCMHDVIDCCPRWLAICAAQSLDVTRAAQHWVVNRSTCCRYKEADLNVGETSCVDRCASKYWQVLPWQLSCVMQLHEALTPPSDIALCLYLSVTCAARNEMHVSSVMAMLLRYDCHRCWVMHGCAR